MWVALDPKQWNIEVGDTQEYVNVSIDNRIWIIEKWKGKDELFSKYGRSMKDFLDIKVDYGRPYQSGLWETVAFIIVVAN